jgi:hypothetical protein
MPEPAAGRAGAGKRVPKAPETGQLGAARADAPASIAPGGFPAD